MLLKQVEKTHGKGRKGVKRGNGQANDPKDLKGEFKARIDPKTDQNRGGVLLNRFKKIPQIHCGFSPGLYLEHKDPVTFNRRL